MAGEVSEISMTDKKKAKAEVEGLVRSAVTVTT
jgi:hypothetical protein